MAAYSVCCSVPDPDSCSAATSHITNQRHAQRDGESTKPQDPMSLMLLASTLGLNVSHECINLNCAHITCFALYLFYLGLHPSMRGLVRLQC